MALPRRWGQSSPSSPDTRKWLESIQRRAECLQKSQSLVVPAELWQALLLPRSTKQARSQAPCEAQHLWVAAAGRAISPGILWAFHTAPFKQSSTNLQSSSSQWQAMSHYGVSECVNELTAGSCVTAGSPCAHRAVRPHKNLGNPTETQSCFCCGTWRVKRVSSHAGFHQALLCSCTTQRRYISHRPSASK